MKYKDWLFIPLFLIPLLIDRVTKAWILQMQPTMHEVIPGLYWDLAFNRGVTWSLFYSKSPVIFGLLSMVIIGVLTFLVWYTFKQWQHNKSIIGELLVLSGGVSNLIDRALYGAVVDFILIGARGIYWPAFNVADICIVLGVGIMIWTTFDEAV
jgi:signal peptidase II